MSNGRPFHIKLPLGLILMVMGSFIFTLGAAQVSIAEDGREFTISPPLSGSSWGIDSTVLPNGSYLVIWSAPLAPGKPDRIRARLLSAQGVPVGSGFQLSQNHPSLDNQSPKVAVLTDGTLLATWALRNSGDDRIILQRLAANGAPIDEQITLDLIPNSSQGSPDVAPSQDGGYFLVFTCRACEATLFTAFGQAFNADGTPKAPAFRLPTDDSEDQIRPQIASLGENGFIVVWSQRFDFNNLQMKGRRLDAAGVPIGGELIFNDIGRDARVAAGTDDTFHVGWTEPTGEISIRLFDLAGSPLGPELKIEPTSEEQALELSDLAVLPGGDIHVAFTRQFVFGPFNGTSDTGYARISSAGALELFLPQVNLYSPGRQESSALAITENAELIVWYSNGYFGNVPDGFIVGRSSLDAVFSDDFESGDFSTWAFEIQ